MSPIVRAILDNEDMNTNARLPENFEKRAFYTPDEVASLLRVHTSTVREWIRTGHLFAYHVSDRVNRIPLGSLMRLLGEVQPVIHGVLTDERAAEVWHEIEDEHRLLGRSSTYDQSHCDLLPR